MKVPLKLADMSYGKLIKHNYPHCPVSTVLGIMAVKYTEINYSIICTD
jgi:hypothetical protein